VINFDDLPLVETYDEHTLTKEQAETVVKAIRDVWKSASPGDKAQYPNFFFYHDEYPSPVFHNQILTRIRDDLSFSEEQMVAASRRILFWIHHTLFARDRVDEALFCHSLLNHQPTLEPFRFAEQGMDVGASSVMFGFLSGQSRVSMAQTNRANHAAVCSQLHRKVQNAIFNDEMLFAVPNLLMPIKDIGDETATTLSQLVKATRQCLKADKIMVFGSKHDAYLYACSRRVPDRISANKISPIITLAALGDERTRLQILDLEDCAAPIAGTYVNPKDFVALKVDLYKGQSNWLGDQSRILTCRFALLKTSYDPLVVMTPRKWVPNLTPLKRQLGHRLFMKSIGNRISSTQEFIRWLDEFYCDQYLIQKRKGQAKRAELKAAIADIKLAEISGLDLGSNIYNCLQFLPMNKTLFDLLRDERLFEKNYDHHSYQYVAWREERVWGWKTVRDTFVIPKLSRHERTQAHQEFMQSLGDAPIVLRDFRKWLKTFYCRYLMGQKNGMEKAQQILTCYEALAKDPDTYTLTIEEYLNKIPPGGDQSLKMIISGRRRGHQEKASWGWQTIEASFIEPERARIAESQPKMAGRGY
jgi:hypothetical protein